MEINPQRFGKFIIRQCKQENIFETKNVERKYACLEGGLCKQDLWRSNFKTTENNFLYQKF